MGMTRVRIDVTAILAMVPLLAPAHASGRLPAVSTTEAFTTDAACLAALRGHEAEDRRQVSPKIVTGDGGTREVSLDTSGVEADGTAGARYDATLWWHNGIPRTDLRQVEISHSYRHRIRECTGRVLRTTSEDGYTASTFTAAEPSTSPR